MIFCGGGDEYVSSDGSGGLWLIFMAVVGDGDEGGGDRSVVLWIWKWWCLGWVEDGDPILNGKWIGFFF